MADRSPKEMTVAQALERRYLQHCQYQPSRVQAARAGVILIDKLSTAVISDLTFHRQERLIAQLLADGYSRPYVARIKSDLAAAVNRAHKRGEIVTAPRIMSVPNSFTRRERLFDIEEIRTFWSASARIICSSSSCWRCVRVAGRALCSR